MKKQDAIRILYAEVERRELLKIQEDRQPPDETTEALKLLLDEVTK